MNLSSQEIERAGALSSTGPSLAKVIDRRRSGGDHPATPLGFRMCLATLLAIVLVAAIPAAKLFAGEEGTAQVAPDSGATTEGAKAPAETEAEEAAPTAQDLLKKFDQLYHFHRHEAGGVKKCREALDQARKLEGKDSYGISWRRAQLQFWLSDGERDDGKAAELAKVGWDWGKKAVQLKPDGVEGQFWLAVNIGQYSLSVGVLRALANGLESKFLEPLDKSIKLDPRYECAGPIRVKGNYHSNLPWPKQDLDKAISMLKRAIELEPCGLRSNYYLAVAYERDDQDEAAIAEFKKIIAAGPNKVDPGDVPRIKKWAREKLKEMTD